MKFAGNKKPVTILRRHGQGIRGLEVQMQFHRTADEVAIGIHQAEDDEVHGVLSIQRVRGDGQRHLRAVRIPRGFPRFGNVHADGVFTRAQRFGEGQRDGQRGVRQCRFAGDGLLLFLAGIQPGGPVGGKSAVSFSI